MVNEIKEIEFNDMFVWDSQSIILKIFDKIYAVVKIYSAFSTTLCENKERVFLFTFKIEYCINIWNIALLAARKHWARF